MAEPARHFDVVVIGGGPGGYVAALRAAQLKLRTALVERESLGGICLNWGCIPTKALLHSADTLRRIRHAGAQGITVSEPQVDFGKVVARSRQVSQRLNRGVAHLLKKAGVTVLMGTAALQSGKQVQVTDANGRQQTLQADNLVIATGARARELPVLPFDGDRIWGYRDALSAKALPKSLVVIGAGAIGMEFASFYATLGTQVTVVEAAPRVLPASDEDVSAFARQAMAKDGIRFLTDATLVAGQVQADGVHLTVEQKGRSLQLQAERVLVAVGLAGNSEGLGLEHTRVEVERGLIQVADWGVTAEPGIHAIGDITGAPMLAHKASHEGIAAVEHIAGLRSGAQHHAPIPSCVYSHPQSAGVGLTEAQARQSGAAVRVGRFPLEGNGKAIAIDEAAGFIKTVFNEATGELLGAHLVGPEATELVHGYTLAAALEATEADLMEAIFPHPTLSEAMHEAVLAAYGRALHI
ncbi:dihydrolipoyl dehydrogenase [Alicycliphilus denitrificans]|mgnify:CR=1 FL=1|uniref:dihydrolipoyl dehydrogenase n=1 Tax=Alicycliphilus denitrificans TaxID=179636 RepID=UPI000963640E|nr:dihydrolipoyl dehydrogenase [Alicycliphilus denitrificans]MBN9573892.1 dihydrolipoyl dehydrogenase [Alicycliphilus denitrificans]OJW87080.1 MAG: dihydrolipoyl dehydrogenase [Alicycliphilus sp. 69-12]BCN39084.1 dihydrolipoyl dehydrogenase [Alicycliphilus denitrificans]